VKRERSSSDADSSRKAQFHEAKAQRKGRKPDAELVEDAKRIYNIVKPNDVSHHRNVFVLFALIGLLLLQKSLVIGGDRETLIHDLLKLIKGRAAKLVLKVSRSCCCQSISSF
jgi:hypothetical protein